MPLILCWLEGRTQDEAAGVLGWTPDSVRGRLHRGRALLHARLARRGLALGTGLLVAAALGQKVSGALPAGLARGTVQASLRFAAGGESGVAAGVMALAEGGMRAMRLTGLKVVAVLLGMTLAVSAGGVLARQLGAREEAGPRSRMEESGTAAQTPGGPELAGGAVARVDCFGDPLPAEALVRLGTTRLRHSQHVMAVRFAPDGKMLAAGTDNGIGVPEGPVRLWDVATGTQLRTLAASPHFIRSLAFSPDGKTLAMGDLMGLTLHFLGDAAADKELPGRSKIEKPMGTVSALAFSPDGKTLTVAAGDGIHLMEASTGKVLHTLTGTGPDHSRHVPALAFSPSGRFLASAGYDQTVRLWEVNAGLAHISHRGYCAGLSSLA